jgi:threonine/homoserine/homoserine lactone efflux protein
MSFQEFLLFFIFAFLGGVVSTAPPGPLNLSLIVFSLKRDARSLVSFQWGILVADILICLFSFFLLQKTIKADFFIQFGIKYFIFIKIFFICTLVFMGISRITTGKKNQILDNKFNFKEKNNQILSHKIAKPFLEGFVGTLTIPYLAPFWYLWWMGQNLAYSQVVSFFAICMGVYFGDLFVFKIYQYFSDYFQKRFWAFSLSKAEICVGYLLIFFAIVFSFKLFLF